MNRLYSWGALLLLIFLCLCQGLQAEKRTNQDKKIEFSYGNWCGGGHGGLQDCCDGKRCSECNENTTDLTLGCFKQCPPVDELDKYCAYHDLCTFKNVLPPSISCFPQGNFCYCDCELVTRAQVVNCTNKYCIEMQKTLLSWFKELSCWYWDASYNPVCNGNWRGKYFLEDFCNTRIIKGKEY